MKKRQEKIVWILIFIATLAMIFLRFLLNEKGRVNPDSIRYMRQAFAFPVIDNVTAPLLYPLSIKLFAIFTDEFWGSKVLGIVSFLFVILWAVQKKYFAREALLVCGLFSFVSIFSYTMSEALILPLVFLFLFFSKEVITGILSGWKAVLVLTLMLVILYSVRYSSLFFMVAAIAFGMLYYKKSYSKPFIFSGFAGLAYFILYKFFFIDYYNGHYLKDALEIGLKPTSQLLPELFYGVTTTFNPFIHIAKPDGGFINFFIYGIGFFTLALMVFIFSRLKLSEPEKFIVIIGIVGIICSYFIQYFYSVNAMDYRLLSPFVFGVWLVFFRKLYRIFGSLSIIVTVLSLMTGFIFTWLSRADYLENRKEITAYLTSEKLLEKPILFYAEEESVPEKIQLAELISTVNPQVYLTKKAADTLKTEVLTAHKVLKKISLSKNKYQ